MSPLSLYQIIHTLEGRIFHLEEHLKLLFEGYYELFNRGVKIDAEAIESQIVAILNASRCPKGVSLFVRILITEQGEISVEEYERSLYKGYTLRCISPKAAVVEYTMPFINLPTTMRSMMSDYANNKARRCGSDIALRSNNFEVDIAAGAQLFGVLGNIIITQRESYSVEHKLAKETSHKIPSMVVEERTMKVEELQNLDELFYVDHYGVTAFKSCGDRVYMSITAGTLAERLAELGVRS